jgi:hypothetical protein
MKVTFKSIVLLSFITISLSSCYYDSLEELHPAPIIIPGINDSINSGCDTAKAITYTNDIKPILVNNCGANSPCHMGTGSNSQIDLSTYSGAKSVESKLIGAITWDGTASNMPKGSLTKINDCSIAIIKKWVNTGAAE